MPKISLIHYGIAGLLLVLTVWLGYFTRQEDFQQILPALCLFYGCLYFVYQKTETAQVLCFFVVIGILLRVVLIPAFPNWSDDIYRFLWDGYLWNAGLNPFAYLPSYYQEQEVFISGLTPALYNKLNSPDYFTIYPPVCQGLFAFSTWLFPNNWYASAIVLKVFIVSFEIGSIGIMYSLLRSGFFSHSKQIKPVLLYALNPLIIFEISGNLHFEGPMVFFLLLALYLIKKKKIAWSALAWTFAVATKLLPLLFLPLLIRRLGWKNSFYYFSIIGMGSILLFLPLISLDFLQNFGNSLDLYFRKFEFNASIYYLIRWLGYQFTGYNIIQKAGPTLALLVFCGTWFIAAREKSPSWKNFPKNMLIIICLYLILAMTIHPWYITLPVLLCIFTQYRFPIIWSGLIMLTYINYSYSEYWENLWIVGLEYTILFGFILYEISGINISSPGSNNINE